MQATFIKSTEHYLRTLLERMVNPNFKGPSAVYSDITL